MNAKLTARYAPPVAVRRIEGPDRAELRRLAAEGHRPAALALVFPYSVAQITWFLLSRGQGTRLGEAGREAIRADRLTGMTLPALARKHGVSLDTVSRALAQQRQAAGGRLPAAAKSPGRRPVLTDEDVRAVRAFVAQHGRHLWVYEALAEAYGVSPSTARNIALGHKRADVT